ncbi:MAG: TOMM precursor leader peptide-binding protein [Bryobacteraceae bacterium]|nr:TOMM precursor leader peptide-binding protein [Bryobacteraceae bacterium]
MKLELQPEKLFFRPTQFIGTSGSLILRRGAIEIKVAGAEAMDCVQKVYHATSSGGATEEEVLALFDSADRPSLEHLLRQLIRRRFLVSLNQLESAAWEEEDSFHESSADVFYWHFGQTEAQAVSKLSDRRITIVGVNCISRQLATVLMETGFSSIEILDDPIYRNLRLFDADGVLKRGEWPQTLPATIEQFGSVDSLDPESFDLLVATSDFGGLHLFSRWNEYCHLHKRNFLPVSLQRLGGYVGPFTVPGETACFDCFRVRESMHAADPASHRAVDEAALEGKDLTGFIPPMASMLADTAAMEVVRFYAFGPPVWRFSSVIEVNLMVPSMTCHRVLKLPLCPVCTPVAERPTFAPSAVSVGAST